MSEIRKKPSYFPVSVVVAEVVGVVVVVVGVVVVVVVVTLLVDEGCSSISRFTFPNWNLNQGN